MSLLLYGVIIPSITTTPTSLAVIFYMRNRALRRLGCICLDSVTDTLMHQDKRIKALEDKARFTAGGF